MSKFRKWTIALVAVGALMVTLTSVASAYRGDNAAGDQDQTRIQQQLNDCTGDGIQDRDRDQDRTHWTVEPAAFGGDRLHTRDRSGDSTGDGIPDLVRAHTRVYQVAV